MAVDPVPAGYHTLTPYLLVKGVPALMSFLTRAFNARENHRTTLENGAIMHAEMQIGDSRVMMGEAPHGYEPLQAGLYLYLPNMDEVYAKAVNAGANMLSAPTDQFYGDRVAAVKDPAGNTWWLATHIKDVSPEELSRLAASKAMKRKDPGA